MVKFVVGGKEYEPAKLTFKPLKKMWPHVAKYMDAPDKSLGAAIADAVVEGFAQVDTAIQIMAICLHKTHPEMTAEVIEDEMYPTEIGTNGLAIQELLKESGLVQAGPPMPSATPAENLSMETGITSSPSSSPQDVKEEAGVE